jgi:hypothetical protein
MRFLLPVLLLVACAPPCERTCRKVLFDCRLNSERVALDECVDSCARQEELYVAWENDELLQLERDHRRCLADSTCEQIAAGECFEGYEELFPFDPDKELPEPPTSSTSE